MRIICLDLGTKTCGFAITDNKKILANPLENFLYSKNDFLQVVNRLKYWFNVYENEIDLILIGYPTNTIGNKTKMSFLVDNFVDLIKTKFPNIEIELFDERFSTQTGAELLMELDIKNSIRKKYKDKMAAFVILNNYLQYKK